MPVIELTKVEIQKTVLGIEEFACNLYLPFIHFSTRLSFEHEYISKKLKP